MVNEMVDEMCDEMVVEIVDDMVDISFFFVLNINKIKIIIGEMIFIMSHKFQHHHHQEITLCLSIRMIQSYYHHHHHQIHQNQILKENLKNILIQE